MKVATLLMSLITLKCLPWITTGATLNDTDTLFNDVIYSNNHRYRPIKNQSDAIRVYVNVDLLFLEDLDPVKETVCLNIFVNLFWTDEIRAWNPDQYGGIPGITPDRLDIWRPRFSLANSVLDRDMFDDNYAPLRLYHNGTTMWSPGGVYVVSCIMDMTYFPVDHHTCNLLVIPNDILEDVRVIPVSSGMNIANYQQDGEWALTNTQVYVVYLEGELHQALAFELRFERRPNFVVMNLILPVVFLSSLSHVVFLVPVESGERMSMSMTIMLSLTVYMSQASSSLPRNANTLPYLSLYLVSLFLHCAGTVVLNGVILLLAHHNKENRPATNTSHDGAADTDHALMNNPYPVFDPIETSGHTKNTSRSSRPHHPQDTHPFPEKPRTGNSPAHFGYSNYSQTPSKVEADQRSQIRSNFKPRSSVYLDDVIRRVTRATHFNGRLCGSKRLANAMSMIRPIDLKCFCLTFACWGLMTFVFILTCKTQE